MDIWTEKRPHSREDGARHGETRFMIPHDDATPEENPCGDSLLPPWKEIADEGEVETDYRHMPILMILMVFVACDDFLPDHNVVEPEEEFLNAPGRENPNVLSRENLNVLVQENLNKGDGNAVKEETRRDLMNQMMKDLTDGLTAKINNHQHEAVVAIAGRIRDLMHQKTKDLTGVPTAKNNHQLGAVGVIAGNEGVGENPTLLLCDDPFRTLETNQKLVSLVTTKKSPSAKAIRRKVFMMTRSGILMEALEQLSLIDTVYSTKSASAPSEGYWNALTLFDGIENTSAMKKTVNVQSRLSER